MNLLSARQTREDERGARESVAVVSALYAEHALGLTRLAYVTLNDRAAAEDVVHDAFAGLCRRWSHLAEADKAQAYLRSSVLNGCRSVLRRQARMPRLAALSPEALSADAPLLAGEDQPAVLAALRQLPGRQREVLVLRYYLDLPDMEIARAMGIRESTVRSTAHRGLAAVERILTAELSSPEPRTCSVPRPARPPRRSPRTASRRWIRRRCRFRAAGRCCGSAAR